MAFDSEPPSPWRPEPGDQFKHAWLAQGWPWPPQEKHIKKFQAMIKAEGDRLHEQDG